MMAGYLNGSTINVTYRNNPQRYTGGYVTEDFFRLVGVSPIMGRDFTAEDNKPGAEKVTILGHEDPAARLQWLIRTLSGRPFRINGKAATIVGVMPPNFKFPYRGATVGSIYIMSFRSSRAATWRAARWGPPLLPA